MYNMDSAKSMHLTFFPQAAQSLLRIKRALQMKQGHLILLGVGGSGRRSLARMAGFMCGLKSHSV